MYDPKGVFIVALPSYNHQVVIESVEKLMQVCGALGRKYLRIAPSGTGLANCRQGFMDQFNDAFNGKANIDEKTGKEYMYVFWLDSDVLIKEPVKNIAEMILAAEKSERNMAANYKGLMGGIYFNTCFIDGRACTDDELANAKPLELKLSTSGIGCAYVKTPIDYVWRTIGHQLEDSCFFEDNPWIAENLYYAPIANQHQKWRFVDNAEKADKNYGGK